MSAPHPLGPAEGGERPVTSTPPLVPESGLFEGLVAVEGDTLISGAVIGSLKGAGTLLLDANSTVEGLIECPEVEAAGRITGRVVAARRVRLVAGATLEGDLDAPTIEVDDAAVWNGRARVGC